MPAFMPGFTCLLLLVSSAFATPLTEPGLFKRTYPSVEYDSEVDVFAGRSTSDSVTNFDEIFAAIDDWKEKHIEKRAGHRESPPPSEEPNSLAARQADEWPDVGYEWVFGPRNVALSASNYMGFVLLDKYSPRLCANACSARTADVDGGRCKFFNIWTAVFNGTVEGPTTCAFYSNNTLAWESGLTNSGNPPSLTIKGSQGFTRKSRLISSATLNEYQCTPPAVTCWETEWNGWTGESEGPFWDATVFSSFGHGHRSYSAIRLGSAVDADNQSGTMRTSFPLWPREQGRPHSLQFYYRGIGDTFVEVIWNDEVIGRIDGPREWALHEYTVVIGDDDVLGFRGGRFPHVSYVDDIYLFRA